MGNLIAKLAVQGTQDAGVRGVGAFLCSVSRFESLERSKLHSPDRCSYAVQRELGLCLHSHDQENTVVPEICAVDLPRLFRMRLQQARSTTLWVHVRGTWH